MCAVIEDTEIEISTSSKQKLCPNYHIIFLNDDYHSFGFVVGVIVKIFRKTLEEAYTYTLEVHQTGQSIVTTCSKERAELYLEQIASIKEGEKGAVSCTMEPAE